MIIEQTTKVILDPTKEYNTIQEYEQDKGWHEAGFSTTAVIFEQKTAPVKMDAMYIPSNVS